MAYTYQGDAILGVSLSVETPKPLDTRTVVNATKDLYNVPADQAYRGMTISNLEDGNIYMLIDKNKINKSEGWKSSQSALQIISCTQEEYNEWSKNTTEDYEPIDKTKNYLLPSVYYYVYEEEGGQYYLSSDWGKNIEDQLSKKASADGLNNVLKKTNELAAELENNYIKSDIIIETYATIELVNSLLNLEDSESVLSKALAPYYTSEQIDDKFVTKASLGGDLEDLGDGENLVFVTSKQYAEDQQKIQEELAKTLKLDGEGSLETIVVGQIKSPEGDGKQLVVEVTPEGLLIEGDQVATESDIPVIITLSSIDYTKLVENDEINPEAYYCIYDEEDNKLVYVTLKDLESTYSTTTQTQFWVAQNFYTMEQIDERLLNLQLGGNEATAELLKNYYTKNEADLQFLTIGSANTDLATKAEVKALETKIGEEYVTITMLKGENTEDTDFMFVTQNQYSEDKDAQAVKFESEEINSTKSTTSELIIQEIEEKEVEQEGTIEGEQTSQTEVNILSQASITVSNGRLMSENKQIALTEEVPQIEPISQADYEARVEAGETDPDVYYFIEDSEENSIGGYVTYEYVDSTFSTKSDTNQNIHNTKLELEQKIALLEAEIQSLKALMFSSINESTLELGVMDNINNDTLIANSGKIENQTLIFT